MDTQELRDSRRTPTCVLGDTGRGALYALDMAMPGAPSLFPFVHEAVVPLSGGTSFSSLGRRPYDPAVLVPGVRNNSWHPEPGPRGRIY